MIFVGNGALLWRAVSSASAAGHPVDLVVDCGDGAPADLRNIPLVTATDVNTCAAEIERTASDGILWSIDNPMIFRKPILDLDLTILNIHGGAIPAYRGLPLVAVIYALLNSESHYETTLHIVDEGIDTGPVVATSTFDIAPDDTFEDVMIGVVEHCHRLFETHLEAAACGQLPRAVPRTDVAHGYYGRSHMAELGSYITHPNFERATDLGLFADFYPAVAEALDRVIDQARSGI